MSTAKASAAPAVVGAFVLGGCLLGLAAIVLFGNLRLFNPSRAVAVVFQGSVDGLEVGAPVTFRGVHVGSVTSIVIVFDQKTHTAFIPVTLELAPDNVRVGPETTNTPAHLSHMIARGLRAELNVQSVVTGQSEIDLDFDPASPALLHPDITNLVEIPTRISPMDKIKNAIINLPLRELTENAMATLKSLRSASDKLDHEVPPLLASMTATSDRAAAAIDMAVRTVGDLQGKVSITLAAITTVANTGTQVLDKRGAELHTLLVSTNAAMQQARDVLSDVKGLTSDRAAARANIESTLRDLAAAAAALRGFSSDVEHNPQLLLTGRRQ
jgi:paraquat-inducible protein B